MAEAKKLIQKLAPFLADHNSTTPVCGTKIKWALDVWRSWAYTPRGDQPGRIKVAHSKQPSSHA